jgi:hypothetical protein
MPVLSEADTLTPATLGAGTDANLVDPASHGAGRDEPRAAALVAGAEDLVAVELEQAEPAKDVPWVWFGGGFWRGVRYSGFDQEILLLVRASGDDCQEIPPGPLFIDTRILS